MANATEKGTLQLYKYITKELTIILNSGKKIELDPDRLVQMTLENRYEEYVFPLFGITLCIENEVYYNIIKNKNTCKIHLRIDKYFIGSDTSKRSLSKKFIDDNFDLILNDSNEDVSVGITKKEGNADFASLYKSKKNRIDEPLRTETFYLNREEIVSGTKKNVNKVINKCNVSDVYAYLLTVAGINNVLMGQPDNTKVYDEILIPPMSVLKALQFIDTYYGLYKSGSMIFFDLDYSYIIPYNGKCVAKAKDEIENTNIIIPTADYDNGYKNIGVLNKKDDIKNNYILADYITLQINENSITNEFLSPSDISVIDQTTGAKTDLSSNSKTKSGKHFTKVISNKTENEYFGSIYTNQHAMNSTVITLVLQNDDVAMLTPNKNFNLIFEDPEYTKKYNGSYILSKAIHTFSLENDSFKIGSAIELKKVPDENKNTK